MNILNDNVLITFHILHLIETVPSVVFSNRFLLSRCFDQLVSDVKKPQMQPVAKHIPASPAKVVTDTPKLASVVFKNGINNAAEQAAKRKFAAHNMYADRPTFEPIQPARPMAAAAAFVQTGQVDDDESDTEPLQSSFLEMEEPEEAGKKKSNGLILWIAISIAVALCALLVGLWCRAKNVRFSFSGFCKFEVCMLKSHSIFIVIERFFVSLPHFLFVT